jgi:hypothetical protein
VSADQAARIDLDEVQRFLETVRPIYEAAGDLQTGEHVCDVRCTAVNHVPDLTSYLSEVAAELRAAREVVKACRAYQEVLNGRFDDALATYDRAVEGGGQ